MKRIFAAVCAVAIVLQLFLPQMIYAVTTDDGNGNVLRVSDIVVENQEKLDAKAIHITFKGHVETAEAEQEIAIGLPANATFLDQKGELKDEAQHTIGQYETANQTLLLTIKPNVANDLTVNLDAELKDAKTPQGSLVFDVNGEKITRDYTLMAPDEKDSVVEKPVDTTKDVADKSVTTKEKKANTVKALAAREPVDITTLFGADDTFLTELALTYKDANGNAVTNPTVDDRVNFKLTFDLPESVRAQMENGDYYTFTLPNTTKILQKQNFSLKNSDGEAYAAVTVGLDGVVKIVFNEKVNEESEIHGDFNFDGAFNEVNIPGPGDITIALPGVDKVPGVGVTIKPSVSSSVSKEGHFDKTPNPNQVIWNVDVNKKMDRVTNATVTENLPAGLAVTGVKVYAIKVDFDGNVIAESATEIPTSDYTVDAAGKVVFLNAIDQPYRIEYTTTIAENAKPGNEGGDVTFKNNVVFDGDEIAPIPAVATVTANYKTGLVKGEPDYHPENQTFDWMIEYNHNEFKIKESQATVHDAISGNMSLVSDSVVLKKVTFDSNGNAQEGATLVAGEDYTLVPAANDKGFDIQFIGDVDYAVNIHYTTKANDVIDKDITYNNSVSDGSGNADSESGTAQQQGLIKRHESPNYADKTIAWVVDVNKNNYQMENWTFTDTLSKGLTYKSSSFTIQDTTVDIPLQEGRDYTFSYDPVTNQLHVTFIGDLKSTRDTFQIRYSTHFDTNMLTDGATSFKNNATSDWVSTTDNTHKNPGDSATFRPSTASKNNGFKTGTYNASNKLITWTLATNYNKDVLNNAKITDKITDNQKYVPGSLKAFYYQVNANGNYTKGAELSAGEMADLTVTEPSDANDKTLTIKIPNSDPGTQIIFEYQTSLAGEVIHTSDSYTNVAKVENDGFPTANITGKVSVANGGSYATKTGAQDEDGYVNWDVMINPSQSTLNNVVVSDSPSTNQVIDESSIIVYTTTIDAAGKITRGAPLDESLYDVVLTTDNVTGSQHLEVKLKNQITASYELSYRSMVFLTGDTGTVSNDLTVVGDNIETIKGEDKKEVNVHVSNGGGTAIGTKGNITLHKVDETGAALTGARFELLNAAKTIELREGTVDSNGSIEFGNLPFGTYILREVQAPAGVSIPPELLSGKPVTIDAKSSAPIAFTNIVNERSKVELSKVGPNNEKLANATFKLEQKEGNAWLPIRANETFTTNQDGKLVVRGLDEGAYRFTETKAPNGYILNTKPTEFTVTRDVNGAIADQSLGPVVNYLGGISFQKVASDGMTGLAGAVFKVTRVADGAGNIVNQPITTNLTSGSDGLVRLTGLAPGRYTLQETKAPTGYILNTQVRTFTIASQHSGGVDPITLANQVNYKGSMAFTKTDPTNQPLSGAVFEIRTLTNQLVQTVTSDSQGKVSATNLAPGKYKVIETQAPANYIVNTEAKFFTIPTQASGEPQVITLPNAINYQGSVLLTKVNGQGEKLQGAEFTLYDANEQPLGVYTSNSAGEINIDQLAPGDYALKETKAPLQSNGQPYILNEFPVDFTIASNQQGEVKQLDLGEYQNFKGIVKLTKIGNSKALSGAVFDLYKSDEEVPIKEVISDDAGNIDYGKIGPGYYKLVETKAPEGFIINKNPIYFVVSNSGGTNQIIDKGNFENYQAAIRFQKTAPDGKNLDTAVFSLTKVTDVDGKKVNQVLTNELKADDKGDYGYGGLAPGKYEIREVKAPAGYIRTMKPHTFEITSEFLDHPGTMELGDFVNYQGSAELTKVSEQNQPLSGVGFQLTNTTTKETSTYTADKNGKLQISHLAPGKYTLQETKAKSGYILNKKTIQFAITPTTETEPATVNLGKFINYKGTALLTKVDANQPTKKLKNTQFKLIDNTGKVIKTNLVTNSAGEITVSNLSPGKYAFVETKAAPNYQIDSEQLPFTIQASQTGKPATQTLTAKNKALPIDTNQGDPTPPTVDKTSPTVIRTTITGDGKTKATLPMTGDKQQDILQLLGTIMLSVGLYITLRKRK
ncbi:LPXTG cell wall anchor domain-containing protein [Listeria booriae]|uniref:SpaA isopeptide-forming pilin-related protein n=1 Tax=Listeria booriae TaxID=1552123 RepID=UPI0016260357|nr:SpaA isopeptide-forming pilin-related protein [Listeria booriae]MBC1918683.1 LPXTG cell wall anchor domain-containing protein [Listeria booriae]